MRWWIKMLFGLAVIALLLLVGWRLVLGLSGLIGGMGDADFGEPDPMFAQEAVIPTRPPELDAEETQPPHATLDDYVPEVETPVDKTAEELIREAEGRS